MKKRITTVIVLCIVFVVALFGFSRMLNRGTDAMTADMGSAVLPVLSFEDSGYQVNHLAGYAYEMDVPTMRDLILPVSVGTTLRVDVQGYVGQISKMTYEILTLDGETCVKKGVVKDVKGAANIELENSIADGQEKVLKLKLSLEHDRTAYYYMRIVRAAESNVQQCLEFVDQFQKSALKGEENQRLKEKMPLESQAKGNGLLLVTPSSDADTIGWENKKPEVVGEVLWEIKESNETYSSVLLKYDVKYKEEEQERNYRVSEFYKVRFLRGQVTLEAYERRMEPVFTATKDELVARAQEHKGQELINDANTMFAFVEGRELWLYDQKKDTISLVFSYADAESKDLRYDNENHSVQVLSMEEDGDLTFAVHGYVNRGIHEGQVGTAIYFYDHEKKVVEEIAFLARTKSPAMMQMTLSKLISYSQKQNMLYAMIDGTLYQVNLKNEEQKKIVENLSEGQYEVSEDGHYIAYQVGGTLTEANTLQVLNLQNGEKDQIQVKEDEVIRPIGFVQGDTVYGVAKKSDIQKDSSGEIMIPLYKVEIQNHEKKVVKSYALKKIYVVDAHVEGTMISLERVLKKGNRYIETSPDSITSNQATSQKEMHISKDASLKLLKPKQLLLESPHTISFENKEKTNDYYVYGYGTLQGIYETAGQAVQAADEVRGVVVTGRQTKIWERGNRLLRFQLENAKPFRVKRGENGIEACVRQLLAYEGKKVPVEQEWEKGASILDLLNAYSDGEAFELTGCDTEQLFYLIGKGTPVLALMREQEAILLTGYDATTVTYLNPTTGKKYKESIQKIDREFVDHNVQLFGYAK